MRTKLSTKGQVVLPRPVRTRLGLRAGDSLDVYVERGRIVLAPQEGRRREGKIIDDPVTGLPVMTFGEGAPVLTSADVREILANFP